MFHKPVKPVGVNFHLPETNIDFWLLIEFYTGAAGTIKVNA